MLVTVSAVASVMPVSGEQLAQGVAAGEFAQRFSVGQRTLVYKWARAFNAVQVPIKVTSLHAMIGRKCSSNPGQRATLHAACTSHDQKTLQPV